MKYRSRTDIAAAILELAKDGEVRKTHIMYGAYLSFNQLNQYLDFLVGKGFLDYDDKLRTYKTTAQGMVFLSNVANISDMLDTSSIDKKIDKSK